MKVTSVLRRYVSLGSVRQILQHPHLLLRLPSYIRQLKQYRFDERYQDGKNTKLRFYPCLNDICANQSISDYYFYQDTWAAQQVFGAKPEYVVDVGSSTTLVGYMVYRLYQDLYSPCLFMITLYLA
jgi:hypothetical protein